MADVIVEIFGDKDPFGSARNSAKDFLMVVDQLVGKSKVLGSELRKSIEGIEFKGLKEVAEFNKQLDSINSTLESTNKLRDASADINKKLRDSQKAVNDETKKGVKVEKEALKVSKDTNDAIELEIGLLDKLQKEQKEQLKSIEAIRDENKELTKQKRQLTKALDEESDEYEAQVKQIDELTESIIDNREEIKKQNKQARESAKLIDSINLLREKEIKSIDDLKKQSAALRTVRNQLDLSTQQNIELIETFNQKIDANSELLRENADSYEQSKINVGNYTDSILDALDQTGLFGEAIGAVRVAQDAFVSAQEKITEALKGGVGSQKAYTAAQGTSTAATEADTAAKKANQVATTRLGKAFRVFNTIAKASGILLVITAITSLVGVLTQGRAGAIKLQQSLKTIGTVAKNVLEVLANVGIVVVDAFKVAFNATNVFFKQVNLRVKNFQLGIQQFLANLQRQGQRFNLNLAPNAAANVTQLQTEISALETAIEDLNEDQIELKKELSESSDAVVEGIKNFSRLGDQIETANQNIIDSFKIGDRINQLKNEVAELNQELSVLEQISEDSTISLSAQANAIEQVLVQTEKLNKANEEIARLELDRANRAVLEDLEVRRESLGLSVAQVSELRRQAENDVVAFAESIERLRRTTEPTEFTLSDEEIDAQQEALRTFLEAETTSNEGILRARTVRRQILQDQVEQELDFLFDAFDRRKQLIEQEIGDERVAVEARVALRDQLVKDFKKNLGQQLELFEQLRSARKAEVEQILKDPNVIGTERKLLQEELKTLENELDFDRLKNITDFKQLNQELKQLGLSEIGINRFKELIVETDAFNKDLIDTNKELEEVQRNFEELTSLLAFDEADVQVFKRFNEEIDQLFSGVDLLSLSEEEFKKITDAFKGAEEERKLLEKQFAIDRAEEEKRQIEERLSIAEEGSEEFLKLQSDLAKKELEIERLKQEGLIAQYEDAEEKRKKIDEKAKNDRLARIKEFDENSQKLLDAIENGFTDRVERQLGIINNLLDENRDIQNDLREDARDGLNEANESLTLQKKQEAELEAERTRIQKQQRQRELALSFIKIFNANLAKYQADVENNPKNPPNNTVLIDSVAEFGLTSGISSAIAGNFIEGTEDIGKALGAAPLGNVVDNYLGQTGGKIFRFDGREAILSPEQNKMRGNLSNDKTVEIAHRYLKGDLVEKSKVFDTAITMTNALMALNSAKSGDYSGAVLSSLRGDIKTLTKEIKKLPDAMPVSHSGFNNKTGMVEEVVRRQGRVQTVLERLNRS